MDRSRGRHADRANRLVGEKAYMGPIPNLGMCRRILAAIVVVAMLFSLIPVGGVAAEASADSVAGTPASGADAQITDRFRAGIATGGLSRADTEGVLEQPTRAAVYGAIDDSPGTDLAGVADEVGVTKSTVRYHVRVLRDAGLIETAEVGGTLRVSTADADAELAGVLNEESSGAVLEAVAEREPASVTALASETDRALSTVSHHLAGLEERGLVERERRGEAVVTSLTPGTRTAMAALPESGTETPADD